MNLLGKLTRLAIVTPIKLSVSLVQDVATMGGVCNDRRRTYTAEVLKEIAEYANDL